MLNELFNYKDGNLYWAVNKGSRAMAGSRAGTHHRDGYRHVKVDGKQILVHRIIYEMHHGPIPEGMQIDHSNGVRDDNRIENLRVVTNAENNQNRRDANGFHFNKRNGKFQAYIKLDGKQVHLGYHETPVDARAAYLRAKREYHTSTPKEYYL